MKFSKMIENNEPNIFFHLDEIRKDRLKKGLEVFNFSVGNPDLPAPDHVMKAFLETAGDRGKYRYALSDSPELVTAVIAWYKTRFGVDLNAGEITSTSGTQEAASRVFYVLCDPEDIVLVPDPGYQIFSFGPTLAGARVEKYPLYPEKGYLLDFNDIPDDLADRAKVILVSYPSNPTCSTADFAFYERLVAFAKKHDIIVLHDNAYCELTDEGNPGGSFLAVPGAKDVGIEFTSLSKSYSLPGMRCGFAVGNEQIISRFKSLRSQIDYGMFLPIQKAAIAAITGPQDCVHAAREIYRERRAALLSGLNSIGWKAPATKATMFCWVPIPPQFKSSNDFVLELTSKTGVICTPGVSFGPRGEGYVRFALVEPKEMIERAVMKIKESGFLDQ